MKILNIIALVLLVLGGLNWFFVGVFDLNFASMLLGHMTMASRMVYIVVGLAAFYALLHFKQYL